MKETALTGFLDVFGELEDPRIDRCKHHPMEEILLLTLCGIICHCEGWNDIEEFGHAKLKFLKQYLPYDNGIPSDDTLRRFYRRVDPNHFQSLFIEWIKSLSLSLSDKPHHVAIDGKTSRRSRDGDNKPLHLVSAFASELGLVLGQQATEEKSNEITAIPKLLQWLDLDQAIVTIDAMGCQTEIAKTIIKQSGHYVLAVKGNQASLFDDISTYFKGSTCSAEEYKTADKGHGRIEERYCRMATNIPWLVDRHTQWPELKSIVEVTSKRTINDKTTTEQRYYISSLDVSADCMLNYIRSHWSIENTLHWTLDMTFREDECRIRKGHAPNNMAILRHIVLNMVKSAKPSRKSIKGYRKRAGWDNGTLAEIIEQNL